MSSSTKDGSKKIQQERIADLVQPGKIYLDATFLKKMGLSKLRMEQCNALFFYLLMVWCMHGWVKNSENETKLRVFSGDRF